MYLQSCIYKYVLTKMYLNRAKRDDCIFTGIIFGQLKKNTDHTISILKVKQDGFALMIQLWRVLGG